MSEYLQYGGQAVVEGVMMRSPRYFAIACRKPDGSIVVQEEPVENSIVGRLKWMNRPFLRGTLALVDAMALGMKALRYSANVQIEAEEAAKRVESRKSKVESQDDGRPTTDDGRSDPQPSTLNPQPSSGSGSRVNDIMIGGVMVFAFIFGVGLFIALPTMMTQLAQRGLGVPGNHRSLNLVDGLIRIAIFLGYIALISGMQNIRRVFQYHGAEHKTINTLEAGEDVVLENCLRHSRIHPRCGTSFIIVVLLASILVHSLFPRPENYFVRLALHIGLIPVVAGAAYEVIKLAGRFRSASLIRFLLAPGLWTQRLTTREPDAGQVEVAMAALNAVLARERAEREAVETAVAV